ncbi:hypothetical protein DDZ13_07385 [Coraliomargarita sinensis]|uniref:HTH cro/C1-type domain-containing protein n=1 Tax=Coraliomargarita sinensis TaxID=2174842 RepID=A0A317ZJD0_9BACT|nr:hypothetical protein DDZ13_07385 [Coraliomargarita sinensis]
MPSTALSEKPKMAQALLKISRAELAEATGKSVSAINKLLNGAPGFSSALNEKIEFRLGVPIWSESPVDRYLEGLRKGKGGRS